MGYCTTPAAGTVVLELGHGVTVVERDAPRTAGAAWIAPYSVNCAEHGWIESRRTPEQCEKDGRAHIAAGHWDLDERARSLGWADNAEMTHQAHNAPAFGCVYCAA